MATELRAIKGTDITQTRFAGGVERGTMLQLTVSNNNQSINISYTTTGGTIGTRIVVVCQWQ